MYAQLLCSVLLTFKKRSVLFCYSIDIRNAKIGGIPNVGGVPDARMMARSSRLRPAAAKTEKTDSHPYMWFTAKLCYPVLGGGPSSEYNTERTKVPANPTKD